MPFRIGDCLRDIRIRHRINNCPCNPVAARFVNDRTAYGNVSLIHLPIYRSRPEEEVGQKEQYYYLHTYLNALRVRTVTRTLTFALGDGFRHS